jgi:hypothetical protein
VLKSNTGLRRGGCRRDGGEKGTKPTGMAPVALLRPLFLDAHGRKPRTFGHLVAI